MSSIKAFFLASVAVAMLCNSARADERYYGTGVCNFFTRKSQMSL